MKKKVYEGLNQNDNSIDFWEWYYTDYYKNKVVCFYNPKVDYTQELTKEYERMSNSYNKRKDKNSEDRIRQESVIGQLNQIKAMKRVLKLESVRQ